MLCTDYLEASSMMKDPAATSGAPLLALPGCIVAMRASVAACRRTDPEPFPKMGSIGTGVMEIQVDGMRFNASGCMGSGLQAAHGGKYGRDEI